MDLHTKERRAMIGEMRNINKIPKRSTNLLYGLLVVTLFAIAFLAGIKIGDWNCYNLIVK